MNWMENVRDWCISRQLWWGHRIPAWTCTQCGKVTVQREDPTVCVHCGSSEIVQDSDVLDTWFSSGLWPFSVFGWPEKTPDLDFFYPTGVVVPAYDILFFWVSRMIFSGVEFMGNVPFSTAYLHGLIRDPSGKKMSKSAGNGIDPIEIIDQYGADALRFYIISGNSAGSDIRFSPEKCESMRNFANKLWNASRFVLMNLQTDHWELPEELELPDRWILTRVNRVIADVTENMEKYELGIAASKIYDFIWSDFCDWYIELDKPRLQDANRTTAEQILCWVLKVTLRLLHPFMPFITEEIWQTLPKEEGESEYLIRDSWPICEERLIFSEDHQQMEEIIDVIRAVRTLRAEMNIPPSKKSTMLIVTQLTDTFTAGIPYLQKLAYATDITLTSSLTQDVSNCVQCVSQAAKVYLPLSELKDPAAEKQRLTTELAKVQKEIATLTAKLENPGFLAKAPQAVVDGEKAKLEKANALKTNLEDGLGSI
jgi:valyl-tRNA synthetase